MYHHHFGLNGPPFQFTPAPGALYLSRTHREALAAIEWGLLQEPSGFTVLTGESGVGKTTLIHAVLAQRYRNVRTALLNNPRLDFPQMMEVVMSQLAPGRSGRSRLDAVEGFAELLDHLVPGERVAIVIDEAHELSENALEGLRLLSDAETFAERRIQIVFVGQPRLLARLARPEMRSLNQRIGARATLSPLGPAEVREYIDCRLRAKGGTARAIFAPAALSYLVARSEGIPRRVNVLGHNSMLKGYAAASKKVSLALVENVVDEYENLLNARCVRTAADRPAPAPNPHSRLMRAAWTVTALALVVAGALIIWSQGWTTLDSSRASVGGTVNSHPDRGGALKTGPGIPPRPVAPTLN
jgi:general secretion pathway protein A